MDLNADKNIITGAVSQQVGRIAFRRDICKYVKTAFKLIASKM